MYQKQINRFFAFLIVSLLFSSSLFSLFPKKYENLSEEIGIDTAIAMPAFNRTEYLKTSLEALAQNPETQELALVFFLDGGPKAKQKEIRQIIESFHFPHCFIVAHRNNLGCERNTIELRSFVFDHCKFRRAVIMEDDLVISPQGIGLLLRMHDWAEENIENFGAITLWSNATESREEKQQSLDILLDAPRKAIYRKWTTRTKGHYANLIDSPQNVTYYDIPWYWVFCMSRQVWEQTRDTQFEYLDRFVDRKNPKALDHPAIRHWILAKLLDAKAHLENTNPELLQNFGEERFVPFASGQDGITDLSLREKGLRYIMPAVNRMMNIGEYGDHFNPFAWRMFCKDLKLEIFEEDAEICDFSYREISFR